MSVTAERASPLGSNRLRTILIAVTAIALVAIALGLLAVMVTGLEPPKPPPKNPFGVGPREAGAPTNAFAAWIMAQQSSFYRAMTSALAALKSGTEGWNGLLWLGFLYGVFHAAGPGHGKAVIAGYIVANEKALVRGVGISFAAAALQAGVAIALVLILSWGFSATARQMNDAAAMVEVASFAAIALLGLWLLIRKSSRLAQLLSPQRRPLSAEDACGHMHVPPPAVLEGRADLRETLGTIAAAGLRPCSGAIILLVFALAQNALHAGIAGVIAMAAGTAITTSVLAVLAVFFKQIAVRFASGRGRTGLLAAAALEVLAAAFLFVFGAALVIGLMNFGAGA